MLVDLLDITDLLVQKNLPLFLRPAGQNSFIRALIIWVSEVLINPYFKTFFGQIYSLFEKSENDTVFY